MDNDRYQLGTTQAIISLGSNVERERNLPEAVRLLRRHRLIDVEHVSKFYESPPVGGPPDAGYYFNAAVLVCTSLSAEELREELRHFEDVLGRVRTLDKNEPRTIDLDVTYFGDVMASFENWELPDPQALTEAHVAIPAADVAPNWTHPKTGDTLHEIAQQLDSKHIKLVTSIELAAPALPRIPVDLDDTTDVYAPKFEALVRQQLFELGEDPDREGLLRTPLRVAKAMDFLTSGYATSLDKVVNDAIFDAEGAQEMVLVKDIEFYSMCEHHMLPFFGRAAVAYLPKGKIIGLSKIARMVDLFGRRLQVQERMTNQVADAIEEILEPHGVGVVVEGKHFCMMMRGVQKQDSSMITSAMRGSFLTQPATRAEFMELVRG